MESDLQGLVPRTIERRGRGQYAAALFVVLGLATFAGVMLAPGGFNGNYRDPDAYTRLLRVEELMTGGAWYDPVLERAEPPAGLRLHWTRPMDVVLLAVAMPVRPFLGTRGALEAAGAFVPPLLLALLGLLGAWGARALDPRAPAPLAGMVVALQPGVLTYGLPGSADHHVLFLLAFTAWLACLLRGARLDRPSMYAVAGAAAGFGLWVSIESILFYALGVAALGIPWLRTGDERWRKASLLYSAAAAGVALAALAVERPPVEWGVPDLHRISLPYVLIPLVAALFWSLMPAVRRAAGRLTLAAVGVAATAGAAVAVAPTFLRGPFAEVDPEVRARWLDRVVELQPILMPVDLQGLVLFVSFLALPVIVWALLGRNAVRRWGTVGAGLIVLGVLYTILALREGRWAPYAEIVAAAVLAGYIPVFYQATRLWRPRPLAVAFRVGVVAGLVVLMPALARAGTTLMDDQPMETAAACDPLRALLALPREPRLNILAHVDHGPRLLYHTPHSVLAAPYHSGAGVLEAYRIMAATEDSDARTGLERWGIDVIALCPGIDDTFFDRVGARGPTLYGRLVQGDVPSWLAPVPDPVPGGGSVFRVVRR